MIKTPNSYELNLAIQSDILRVFQSKDQTRAFYRKISRVDDLRSERKMWLAVEIILGVNPESVTGVRRQTRCQ